MERPRTITATAETPAGSHPSIAMLQRWNVTRTAHGYVARYFNFQKGETADALVSNALRVSPLGEEYLEAGQQVELELLEGVESLAADTAKTPGFVIPFDDEGHALGSYAAVGLRAAGTAGDTQTTEIPISAGEMGDFSSAHIIDTERDTGR